MCALFLLMVFISPIAIKAAHHHKQNYYFSSLDVGKKPVAGIYKPCYVCNFEFVSFIICNQIISAEYPVHDSIFRNKEVKTFPKHFIISYSLRAPPVS